MGHKMKIGLIRVLTTKDEYLLSLHGRIIETAFPDLEVISKCIEDQPQGIYDEETERIAEPKIVKLAQELEKENIKAIIISCAADPAINKVRRIVEVPVVGAGSAAALLALSYGKPVAVLGITEGAPPAMAKILGRSLMAEGKPKSVKTTLDLMTEEGKKETLSAAEELKRKGAGVIVLACTGMSTIGIAKEIEVKVGIPVVDPVIATGLFAWYLVRKAS